MSYDDMGLWPGPDESQNWETAAGLFLPWPGSMALSRITADTPYLAANQLHVHEPGIICSHWQCVRDRQKALENRKPCGCPDFILCLCRKRAPGPPADSRALPDSAEVVKHLTRLEGPHGYKPQDPDPHAPCTCREPKPAQLGLDVHPYVHDQACRRNSGQFAGSPGWRKDQAAIRTGLKDKPAGDEQGLPLTPEQEIRAALEAFDDWVLRGGPEVPAWMEPGSILPEPGRCRECHWGYPAAVSGLCLYCKLRIAGARDRGCQADARKARLARQAAIRDMQRAAGRHEKRIARPDPEYRPLRAGLRLGMLGFALLVLASNVPSLGALIVPGIFLLVAAFLSVRGRP